MHQNIFTIIIVAALCLLAVDFSQAKPTQEEMKPLKKTGAAKQFLAQILDNQPESSYDVCYRDNSITCSCPDGYYCCIKGDPSCLGACCPAGSYCTPDGRGCY